MNFSHQPHYGHHKAKSLYSREQSGESRRKFELPIHVKAVAAYFEEKEQVRKQQFDKEPSVPSQQLDQFLKPGSVVLDDLAATYAELLRTEKYHQPETETIENETLSIEDATDNIMAKLKTAKKMTFKSLLKLNHNIEEIVTDFMAILELARQQIVSVDQADFKSELFIELRN